MGHPEVEQFFEERKQARLKKQLKANASDSEKLALATSCEEMFALENWLPKAAQRAEQLSYATHPCTFSHASARKNKNGYVIPVNYASQLNKAEPGFMYSDTLQVAPDALGNAAVLDVYKFLHLNLQDGQSISAHLQQDTPMVQALFDIDSASYTSLKAGFMKMLNTDAKAPAVTSFRIKQVYFPLPAGDYHLLSILTHSGLLFEMKRRIDAIRFFDNAKEIRECKRKQGYSEVGFKEIFNVTVIGFGGTKPQNISVLNNDNGGQAYLLSSLPPKLIQQRRYYPKKDFFTESLRLKDFKEDFEQLHQCLTKTKNNQRNRTAVDQQCLKIFRRVVGLVLSIRKQAPTQVHRVDNSHLPSYQTVLLHPDKHVERQDSTTWLDSFIEQLARWYFKEAYPKILGEDALSIGDDYLNHLQYKLLKPQQEFLR